MIVLYVILAIIAVIVVLLLIALIKTLATPAKVSEFVPTPQPEREQIYAEKLSKMVQYETESVRGEDQREKFLGFHKVLEELFPNVHATMEKTEIDGNLLFKWKGLSDEKPIVLMGHQDVVPAEGEWDRDPYSGEISEGRVWGRGSADTKCSVMSFFQACEELIAEGYTPQYDIYLSSSCTEEIGGDGCPKIVDELERRGVKPWLVCDEGGAIVEEPLAGCKGSYAMIGVVEKGYGDLEFIARSNGGHSSYPPKNSPIARLSKFVVDIEKHDPMKSEFLPQTEVMFAQVAPYGPFYYRYLFGNFWLFKPLLKKLLPAISPQAGALLKTTVAFTMQSGSEGYNVLPQEAKVVANLRFSPLQDMDESIAIMKGIADKYDIETRVIKAYKSCRPVDMSNEAFKYVEDVVNEVFPGLPAVPYVMTGGTDAKFYDRICPACIRFSPVLYGPDQMKGMHGLNECIDTVSLPGAVDYYKTIICNVKKNQG